MSIAEEIIKESDGKLGNVLTLAEEKSINVYSEKSGIYIVNFKDNSYIKVNLFYRTFECGENLKGQREELLDEMVKMNQELGFYE